jgi:hypothetical protein
MMMYYDDFRDVRFGPHELSFRVNRQLGACTVCVHACAQVWKGVLCEEGTACAPVVMRCPRAEHFASDYDPRNSRHRVVIEFNSDTDGAGVRARVSAPTPCSGACACV